MTRTVLVFLAVFSTVFPQTNSTIRNRSTSDLINCLYKWTMHEEDSTCWDLVAIEKELARRDAVKPLMNLLDSTHGGPFLQTLLSIKDKRVTAYVRRRFSGTPTQENFYFAIYLIEHGDTSMLAVLNRKYWKWEVSSAQRGDAATLFARQKYRPALKHEVESLSAASGNLVEAAEWSLRQFFPDAPKFNSIEETKKYFNTRINK